MSKWLQIKLGDIGKIITGKTPPTANPDNYGGYIPFITPSDMYGWRDIVCTERYLTEQGVHAVKNNVIPAGTICVSCIGSDMGKVVIARKRCVTNQQINSIIVNDRFDKHFVYYLLLTQKDVIRSLGRNGTAIPILNKSKFSDIKVRVPLLEEQRKIADILSAYDDLIENNRKQIKLLEEAAQKLYKEWFIDLRFPGHENTKIVDGIPEGWERKTVGQLLNKFERTKQVQAADYLETGLFPIIDQSRNFIAGYTNDAEALIQHSQPIIVFGDHTRVLKLISFPFAKGADGTQIIVSNNSDMPQHLFYCSLREIDLSNYHYARHFKYLKTEEILIPTKKIAQKIEMQLSYFFTKIQLCRNIIIQSESARNILLPKLMNGELEVE